MDWIVPEPNPIFNISIDNIDIYKLNYDDVYWICSSTMKHYRDEFSRIGGFVDRVSYLVSEKKKEKKQSTKKQIYDKIIQDYNPTYKEPPIIRPL